MKAAALAPIAGSSLGFYLPLAVVPLFAHASSAGLATGAFLVATVLFELVTPRIVARLGYRLTLAAGLVLLGAPALLFLRYDAPALIVAVNAVRGIGFAIATVAGGALTASMVSASRRGQGVALIGVVSGVCSLVAMPLGMWLAGRYGFGLVFALTAAAPTAALLALPSLPRTAPPPSGERHALRPVVRPAVVFAACTSAAGVMVTFLPLAVSGAQASIALLVQPAVATAFRWLAGRIGDRRGQARLLIPGMLLSVAGMGALALVGSPTAVLAGSAVFGAGFGILQNATLTMMYASVPLSAYSGVSAIWNAAYDLGMAVGAIGVGLVVSSTGFPLAFLLTAAAMVPALALCGRRPAEVPELLAA
ncbi:MFS transporter [Actinoplanes sp. CA-030573]|uniref:MFS transporter n=1 Tax=Actinoplanes sp. CA-030573 TaxID=3239898 RepID=UPI003D89DAEE